MGLRDDHGFRYLIRDGAGQFTRSLDDVLAGSGISVLRIPPRPPLANAHAERWVQTLRHELLDRTIIWNEKQLRALVVAYIEHYNSHRRTVGSTNAHPTTPPAMLSRSRHGRPGVMLADGGASSPSRVRIIPTMA